MSYKLINLTAVFFGLLLTSCSYAPKTTNAAPPNVDLQISDNIQKRQFEVRLVSHDSRAVCLPVDQWPAKYGALDSGGQLAWVIVDDQSFPAADDNFGLCPGGCGYIKIEANQSLSGRIGYDQFLEAGKLLDRPDKHLKYEIFPVVCNGAMKIVEPR